MPKTKFQNIIFTLIMAFIMVYAMICYNISLNKGQMSNEVFLLAFHEMVIMCIHRADCFRNNMRLPRRLYIFSLLREFL